MNPRILIPAEPDEQVKILIKLISHNHRQLNLPVSAAAIRTELIRCHIKPLPSLETINGVIKT